MNVWDRLSYFVVALLVLATLAGVFFWYLPLFQTNTQLRKQIYVLDVKILEQERLNRQLRSSIEAAQKDTRTVERLAREKLSFARTNETVFRFETPTKR
jgi:cell division protein FtsB